MMDNLTGTYNRYKTSEAAINLYFVPSGDDRGNATLPAGRDTLRGVINLRPAVVVVNENALTPTLVHEFGHFFGLYHTNVRDLNNVDPEPPFGHPDHADRFTTGDLIPDTPAEPNSPKTSNYNAQCDYDRPGVFFDTIYPYDDPTWTGNDAKWRPNANNFMTTNLFTGACRSRFSQGQKNVMNAISTGTFADLPWADRSSLRGVEWVQITNIADNANSGGNILVVEGLNTNNLNSGGYLPAMGQTVSVTPEQERFDGDFKHQEWSEDLNNYKLTLPNLVINNLTDDQTANFFQLYPTTIKTNFFSTNSLNSGTIGFKDPWYVSNVNNDQPNQFKNESTLPFIPTGKFDESSGGIFRNVNPNVDPVFYSVRAQDQSINGTSYFLDEWTSTGGVNFTDANASTTSLEFTGTNTTVTANMKGHLASNEVSATSGNSSRKVVVDGLGYWHAVYVDNNAIYYTTSTNGGSTWSNEEKLWQGTSANPVQDPTIATSSAFGTNYYHVAFDEKGSYLGLLRHKVRYLTKTLSTNWTEEAVGSTVYENYTSTNPAIHSEAGDKVWLVWEHYSGLAIQTHDVNQSSVWGSVFSVSGTNVSSNTPSIDRGASSYFTKIVWADDSEDEILYITGDANGSSSWNWSSSESLTSGYSSISNPANPSITIDGSDIHIVWQGDESQKNPVYYYDYDADVLTTLSTFNKSYRRPTIAYQASSGDLALSYYEDIDDKVFYNVNSGSGWLPPNVLGNFSGQHPTLNTGNSAIRLLATEQTTVPYIIGNRTIYSSSKTSSPTAKTNGDGRYYRRVDLDLANISISRTNDIFGGAITLDVEMDTSYTNFPKTSRNKQSFFETTPFRASSRAFKLRLRIDGHDFEQRGQVQPEWLNEKVIVFEAVEPTNPSNTKELHSISVANLIAHASQQDPFELNLIIPLEEMVGRDVIVQARFNHFVSMDNTRYTEIYEGVEEDKTARVAATPVVKPSDAATKTSAIPTDYALFQNYPNPFNPTTQIEFEIPQTGFVQLTVFDINGHLIQKLMSNQLEAGRYTTTWDGKNSSGQRVGSGVYLYRLVANDFVSTKKMTLVQ
ncbi:MAG: T9SS type A sorting domain-containing protein [Calditrichia bacterium]